MGNNFHRGTMVKVSFGRCLPQGPCFFGCSQRLVVVFPLAKGEAIKNI